MERASQHEIILAYLEREREIWLGALGLGDRKRSMDKINMYLDELNQDTIAFDPVIPDYGE